MFHVLCCVSFCTLVLTVQYEELKNFWPFHFGASLVVGLWHAALLFLSIFFSEDYCIIMCIVWLFR